MALGERDFFSDAKLRDDMIRVDDAVACTSCGKRFDVPSRHSMVVLQQREDQ